MEKAKFKKRKEKESKTIPIEKNLSKRMQYTVMLLEVKSSKFKGKILCKFRIQEKSSNFHRRIFSVKIKGISYKN